MSCLHRLFDAPEVPSACFVLDEARLKANAAVLNTVQERSGAKILLALKGFAAWGVFSLFSRFTGAGPLWGVCASSVDEARLGREEFGGEVHAFAAAWREAEIHELLPLVDHIVFNSLAQQRQFQPLINACNKGPRAHRPLASGLRINPEHSEGAVPIYDPCAPGSRLGIRRRHFGGELPTGVSGLHFHTLCEQGADALARTLAVVEEKFGPYLAHCAWINCGGGHHITKPGYDLDLLCACLTGLRQRYGAQIYLEPGEAAALDAGWLTAEVLDVVEADMPVAVLDVSAACHMPDVLEMPYRPDVFYRCETSDADGEQGSTSAAGHGDDLGATECDGLHGVRKAGETHEAGWTCRLAGNSCLAGDVIGEYSFARPLRVGQRLVFDNMAIYSMVKTTTFNGLRLPSIGVWGDTKTGNGSTSGNNGRSSTSDTTPFRLLRSFGYEDFKMRLS